MKLSIKFRLICLLSFFFVNTCNAKIYYLDPYNGSLNGDGSLDNPLPSLSEIIESGLIKSYQWQTPFDWNDLSRNKLKVKNSSGYITSNDVLVLLDGNHGAVNLSGYVNTGLIKVISMNQNSAVLESLYINSSEMWLFENIKITDSGANTKPKGNNLVFINSHNWKGPSKNITIKDSLIESTQDVSNWTKRDWIDKARTGIRMNGEDLKIENSTIQNVQFGIKSEGTKNKVIGNKIINFSGDAIRGLSSNSIYESNLIANALKVDGNHDDGFQSWSIDGKPISNITIKNNKFIYNLNHPNINLASKFQGIGLFDGIYENFRIENNILQIATYHGITMMGTRNSIIINNTLLDAIDNDNVKPWILIKAGKDGYDGYENYILNNIGHVSSSTSEKVKVSQNLDLDYNQYDDNFLNYQGKNFDLKLNSFAVDRGVIERDIEPSIYDANGKVRDMKPDIGALELDKNRKDILNVCRYN